MRSVKCLHFPGEPRIVSFAKPGFVEQSLVALFFQAAAIAT